MIDIATQLKCVRRELALRRSAYPKWVASGKLKQMHADQEIAAMEAVEATLSEVLLYRTVVSLFSLNPDEITRLMKQLADNAPAQAGDR